MKTLLLLFSLNLVKLALHCYGWRTGPKPPGYLRGGDRPYWRPMPGKPNHIQAEPHPSRDLCGSHQHQHQGGTAMKERPILFSGPMVRAILNGTKTQTRRIVKPSLIAWIDPLDGDEFQFKGKRYTRRELCLQCPYGQPGDRLWVKETHFESRRWRHAPLFAVAPDFMYRADYEYREGPRSVIGCHHWRPSIFCTRQASRITLEVVSVRVARLQDISEADAVAEGIEPVQMPTGEVMFLDYLEQGAMLARSVSSYATLWASINGPGSWALNPWVWVVEFQRKEPV